MNILSKLAALLGKLGLPADKAMHLVIGLLVALFGLALGLLATAAGLRPAAVAVGVAAIVAGIVKEAADWLDNRSQPGLHGVEPLDALATAAPGLMAAIVIQVAPHVVGL